MNKTNRNFLSLSLCMYICISMEFIVKSKDNINSHIWLMGWLALTFQSIYKTFIAFQIFDET